MARPFAKLRGIMKEHDDTQEDLARILKTSNAQVSLKFNNKSQWRIDEMYAIMDHYGLQYKSLYRIFPPKGQNELYDRRGKAAE